MLNSTPKQILGLDVGQASVKAVVLARRGRRTRLINHARFVLREEGVLDEEELWHNLADWLAQQHLANLETVVGIPQYYATTQINDFPAGDENALERMVEYETRHLAGLSDERFIHGYAKMTAARPNVTPVLIGVCRSALIEERFDSIENCNVRVADIGLNGVAFAAACINLAPTKNEEVISMALNIGAENTTLAIFRGKTVVHLTSVPAGMTAADNYHAEEYHNRQNLETRLDTNQAADTSRVREEIELALEHWRDQLETSNVSTKIDRILVAGGGAKSTQMLEALTEGFNCPAETIGVVNECGDKMPELVTAYGLALQGLKRSAIPISMMPEAAKKIRLRRRRFKFVAAAATLLICALAYHETKNFFALKERQKKVAAELENIEQCQRFVPDLEKIARSKDVMRRSLLPFAAKAARQNRYATTIRALIEDCQAIAAPREDQRLPNAWIIYLVDSTTFAKTGEQTANNDQSARRTARRRPIATGGIAPTTPTPAPPRHAFMSLTNTLGNEPKKWYELVQFGEFSEVTGMVAAVITPTRESEPFKYISSLIRLLELRPEFKRVDLLAQKEYSQAEDIFSTWTKILLKCGIRNCRGFLIRIPFNREQSE